MNQKEFNEVIIRQTDRCKSMLVAKGAEYGSQSSEEYGSGQAGAFQEGSSGAEYHAESSTYGDAVQASDLCIGYVYG